MSIRIVLPVSIIGSLVLCACDASVTSMRGATDSADAPNSEIPKGTTGGTEGASPADGENSAVHYEAKAPPPPPAECIPTSDAQLLSETCLYTDIATQTFDYDVQPFEPAYKLWSDGASKRRWIRIPRGAKIDTSDMNHWDFPVGTQLFKEFSLNGVRLETRLIQRIGPNPGEYGFVSFVWRADQSDAVATTVGASDVNGTPHDVPSKDQCVRCHQGEPGRVLGFSAVQLSKTGPGLTLETLVNKGLLSQPPPPGTTYSVPGNATESAALGYLHANCGHCHNPLGSAYPRVSMVLQTRTEHRDVATHPVLQTAVGVNTTAFTSLLSKRIQPGNPNASELIRRDGVRGVGQMPPLGTEEIDNTGLGIVSNWIQGLTP